MNALNIRAQSLASYTKFGFVFAAMSTSIFTACYADTLLIVEFAQQQHSVLRKVDVPSRPFVVSEQSNIAKQQQRVLTNVDNLQEAIVSYTANGIQKLQRIPDPRVIRAPISAGQGHDIVILTDGFYRLRVEDDDADIDFNSLSITLPNLSEQKASQAGTLQQSGSGSSTYKIALADLN